MNGEPEDLSQADFAHLLRFRDGLRRFLHWSDQQAKTVGITGAQHQLLLAVRGHGSPPSIGDLAEHLLLRHHSAVELVARAAAADLVERVADPDDQRVVRVRLTPMGNEKIQALSAAHIEELARLRGPLTSLWNHLPGPVPGQPNS